MPTLKATDGVAAGEQIRRVDIAAGDIQAMSDEELTELLKKIRSGRETGQRPQRTVRVAKPAVEPADPNAEIDLDDSE